MPEKCPNYIIIARQIFFPDFLAPLPPSPTPMIQADQRLKSALLCIHCMNQVNFRNGCAVTTACSGLFWIVLGFFTISSNETTRGHTCKLFVCHSRVDVRKYFLCNRVVKVWNSLPATSDDFTSIRIVSTSNSPSSSSGVFMVWRRATYPMTYVASPTPTVGACVHHRRPY